MTKEEQGLQEKFIRLIKARKKNPNDKDIRKKLSAVWAQMHSEDR